MKTLIFTLTLLNLSILSVNANDALLDNIANSGSRNFEKMRKGWLPNAEERYNHRMMELRIQEQEQALRKSRYEPGYENGYPQRVLNQKSTESDVSVESVVSTDVKLLTIGKSVGVCVAASEIASLADKYKVKQSENSALIYIQALANKSGLTLKKWIKKRLY